MDEQHERFIEAVADQIQKVGSDPEIAEELAEEAWKQYIELAPQN